MLFESNIVILYCYPLVKSSDTKSNSKNMFTSFGKMSMLGAYKYNLGRTKWSGKEAREPFLLGGAPVVRDRRWGEGLPHSLFL